jgi:hypothetical protein
MLASMQDQAVHTIAMPLREGNAIDAKMAASRWPSHDGRASPQARGTARHHRFVDDQTGGYVRYRAADGSNRRSRWTFAALGAAIGAGCHTLLILILGMAPRRGDDPTLWSMYFIYASAVPVFLIVVIGLILAPQRSPLGSIGVGLVCGAVASPVVWLAIS